MGWAQASTAGKNEYPKIALAEAIAGADLVFPERLVTQIPSPPSRFRCPALGGFQVPGIHGPVLHDTCGVPGIQTPYIITYISYIPNPVCTASSAQ